MGKISFAGQTTLADINKQWGKFYPCTYLSFLNAHNKGQANWSPTHASIRGKADVLELEAPDNMKVGEFEKHYEQVFGCPVEIKYEKNGRLYRTLNEQNNLTLGELNNWAKENACSVITEAHPEWFEVHGTATPPAPTPSQLKFPHLTQEEKDKYSSGVIQVNGKAMNRTALGIVDAYFTLYPNSTFAELKEAFPDFINPSGPRAPKTIFKPFTNRDFGVVHSLNEIKSEFGKANLPYDGIFFLEKEEMFKTSDGVTVVVNKLWESKDTLTGKSDLENLANQALKYGIVVNKYEARKAFGKGSYSLDILQPQILEKLSGTIQYVDREVVREKKVIPWWVWLLLLLAFLIPLLLWLAGAFDSEPKIVQVEKEKIVTRVDTVYVKEIENLEAKFNTVQYQVGKYDIPEDAKYALYDLAKVLEKQPDVKLKIEGHTSKEGDANFNQTLSANRAKAVVDFLVARGTDSTRLSFEGLGSSKPIDPENLDKNRRTEFIIIR